MCGSHGVLLIAASAAVTAGLLPFTEQIMRLFGAEERSSDWEKNT